MTAMAALRDLFDGPGGAEYLGETVTVAEHMLQCAALARDSGAPAHLIVAALTHDVGHLVGGRGGGVSGADLMLGTDNHHGDSGAAWLGQWFGPDVTEPVRLHVAAKRYLCATDPDYFDRLSEASVFTLGVQGGPMDAADIVAFESLPHVDDAIAVRRWDDEGKDPRRPMPSLDEFVAIVTAVDDTQSRGQAAAAG